MALSEIMTACVANPTMHILQYLCLIVVSIFQWLSALRLSNLHLTQLQRGLAAVDLRGPITK